MSQPIIVFDSGIGGLSILNEIRVLLPKFDYVYLFDNARLPYGELEEQDLIDGCVRLVTLLVKKVNAAMVVIACNTASTLVLPELRRQLSIPVVGVVPAIKPAALLSKTKKIALLATPGTIKRFYTKKLIQDFANNCNVQLFGSSELVFIAEQKLAGEVVNINYLKQIMRPIIDADIDVLVLGCTHFPMLMEEMQSILGDRVLLLHSGRAVANRVQSLLGSKRTDTQQIGSEIEVSHSETKDKGLLEGYFTTKTISPLLEENLIQLGFKQLNHLTPEDME